jgi:translation initiation factor 2 gamma subunit (eIF-2gamma)
VLKLKKISISTNIKKRWRLIGWGEVLRGEIMKCEKDES